MLLNVALSDPDTTSLYLAQSNVKLEMSVKTLKRSKYSFLFIRKNTKITKLDTLDWNVNYSVESMKLKERMEQIYHLSIIQIFHMSAL